MAAIVVLPVIRKDWSASGIEALRAEIVEHVVGEGFAVVAEDVPHPVVVGFCAGTCGVVGGYRAVVVEDSVAQGGIVGVAVAVDYERVGLLWLQVGHLARHTDGKSADGHHALGQMEQTGELFRGSRACVAYAACAETHGFGGSHMASDASIVPTKTPSIVLQNSGISISFAAAPRAILWKSAQKSRKWEQVLICF